MPFCPECRFEYKAGVRLCPDCGSELVAELHAEPAPQRPVGSDFQQVRLCTLSNEIEASLLEDRLRAAGIPSRRQLGGILDSPYYPASMPAPAGSPFDTSLRIYVRRRDFGRARQLLDDFTRYRTDDDIPESVPPE